MTAAPPFQFDCRRLREGAAGLSDWLAEQRAIDATVRGLVRDDAEQTLVDVATLARADLRPPAIGILGPVSSAGQRLVQALCAPRDPRLVGQFAGSHTRLPVVGGLLPAGHAIGAAVIVRLTHEDPSLAAGRAADIVGRLMTSGEDDARRPADSSLKVEILSLADVITILARAYLANVAVEPIAGVTTDIVADLDRVRDDDATTATQTGLAAHHVFAIRRSLEARFPGHPLLAALSATGYWDVFAAVAPRAGVDMRRRLASLLWGGLADFDAVYGELAAAIEALNHVSEIVVPAEAVRSGAPAGWSVAHPETILAAGTMLDMTGAAGETVAVRSRFGQPVPVSRQTLATLAAEVTLVVEGGPDAVLSRTDIVQLPHACPTVLPRGGRSGSGLAVLEEADGVPWLARAVLQAKTLVLVERAVEDHALAGLLVHIDPAAPLADAFAPVLADWVHRTQGRTPVERESMETTVFVAVGADQPATGRARDAVAWPALGAFLTEFGDGENWLERWTTEQAFDNVFILGAAARPGLTARTENAASAPAGTALQTYDPTGGLGIDGGLWLRHVRNSAVALDEALNADDGGIAYLVQSVGAIDYARVKRQQLTARLAALRQRLADDVRRHLVAARPGEDHDWRHRTALATQARLRQVAAARSLGALVETLSVAPRTLGWLFDRVLADDQRRAATGATMPMQTLRDLSRVLPADGATAARLARRFATLAVEHWVRTVRAAGRAPTVRARFGYDDTSWPHLVDEIVAGLLRAGVVERIEDAVAHVLVSAGSPPELTASRAAFLAGEIMQTHLSRLGFDSPWSQRHPRRPGTLGAPLFERSAAAAGEPDGLTASQAARMTVQYNADWCDAFKVLVEDNVAAARGMRLEEGTFRELEELLALLGAGGREASA